MKRLGSLLFAVLLSITAWAGSPPPDWENELVKEISSRMARQMRQNQINDSLGMSHRNNYVVNIYPRYDWLSKHDWVDERGQEANRMFSEDVLRSFDTSLKMVNNNSALTSKKTALYVVIVNDWELSLETTIAPTDKITKLSELGERAKEDAFNRLKANMALLPGTVEREIKGPKGLTTVYIHVMANILVYDRPDIPRNQVSPKRFTFVSFPESLVRYGLKGVGHIKELGGKGQLIQENIRLFGDHFIGKYDPKLAHVYTIPEGERAQIDAALQKPLRDITEAADDPKRSMYDYTNLITDETKLAHLEQLGRDLREGNGGGVYMKTFFTDFRMPADKLAEIKKYTGELGRNDLVAWVHLEDASGKVTAGMYFGPGLEERLSKNFLDHTKDFLKQTVRVYHKFTSIPYQGLAWVAGGISKLLRMTQVPEMYFDPSRTDYDPTLFALYYMGRVTSEAGAGVIVNTVASDAIDFGDKVKAAFARDLANKQYEFAFVTGLWNGVIEELAGVTDAVEMLCHAYTDPPTIDQVNGVIGSILDGRAFAAIGTQLKNRYDLGHFSEYKIIHHAGKDIIAIASLFVVVGEISGAAKVSKAFARLAEAAKVMDLISLTRYLYKSVNGIKLYRLGQKATTFFRLAGDHANTVINLVNEAGVILSKTDLSLMRQVEVRLADGAAARMTVWVDPTENLKDALYQMRALVKDKYGNKIVELTDNATGTQHLGLEPADASRLIDEAEELATLLASLQKKVPAELWDAFMLDFSKNLDMLKKFDRDPGLITAWKILHKEGNNVLKVSPEVLTKMRNVLKHPNLVESLYKIKTEKLNIASAEDLVNEMVRKQKAAGQLVGSRVPGMADLMDDFNYFLTNFASKPGAAQLIKEMVESGGKMAGGSFVLKTIRSKGDLVGTIQKFEATVSSTADDVGDIVVDVVSDNGGITIFNEFKNWGTFPANRYSSFTRQFVGYLASKNIGEFSYFFRKGATKAEFGDLATLKTEIAKALKSEKAMFDNLPDAQFQRTFGFNKAVRGVTDSDIQALLDKNFEKIFNLID